MTRTDVDQWFIDSVLPLEGVLERYLRGNWRDADEISDLRQEVYARIYASALTALPESARAFVLSTARHLLIDRARRARIVAIETFADIDELNLEGESSTDRHVTARSELRFLQQAIEALPPRCREVVELRKVEGLSQREVAARMGITEDTVERQVAKGIRALAIAFSRTNAPPMTDQQPGMAAKKKRQ